MFSLFHYHKSLNKQKSVKRLGEKFILVRLMQDCRSGLQVLCTPDFKILYR